jgi:hypothetical protein
MSTSADTSVRGHIDAKLRRVDRQGGNRTANIEKMTEAKHVVSLNPPRISFFPGEFFNNIGRQRPFALPISGNVGIRRVSTRRSDSRPPLSGNCLVGY